MSEEKDTKVVSVADKQGLNHYVPILRIGISGNVDSGKSTFLGVLKTGIFDDGKGKTRQGIFNHPHERETGRTSSVSQESIMIGDRRVHFHDLPGHEKYFRTMIFGLSSSYPNAAIVMVEATRGVQKMTKEHIITAIYLRIPIIVVITKIDVVPEKVLNLNIQKICSMFKNVGKETHMILKESDIDNAIDKLSDKFVPIFQISNVKGNTIEPPFDYIKTFISKMPVKSITIEDGDNPLFTIDKSFRAKGYPFIASGKMKSGKLNLGDKLFLGPVNNEYVEVSIKSVHDDDRNNVSFLRKDELGCISLKLKDTSIIKSKEDIKAGMIITKKKLIFTKTFMSKIVLFTTHSSTIRIGYNTIIHCGVVKKTVVVKKIYDKDMKELEYIRGGDSNVYVKFRFLRGSEYLEVGDLFVFREQNTVGSGMIEEILEDKEKDVEKCE